VTITNRVSLKSVMAGVTPIADVPDGAVVGAVTSAFDGTATVAATAAATGGTPTTFTITPTPTTSPATFTGASPVTVTGLSDGTSYTFTAAGVNTTATGPAGSASASTAIVTAGSFFSIATTTVGVGGASSVTFSNIPQGYTHLQIRAFSRSSTSGNGSDGLYLQVNTDTGANYSRHYLAGTGGSAVADGQASQGFVIAGYCPRAGQLANCFGTSTIDILDYSSTNKNTTIKSLGGVDTDYTNSFPGYITLFSGLWMNTAAVTSIRLYSEANNLVQYSHFALYGVIA
jgi:hypothetical protein